jgi:uncharacterized protein
MKDKAALILLLCIAFVAGTLYSPPDTENRENMTASAKIVAAASSGDTGEIGEVQVDAVPGDGDVLVETSPFIQADTQLSAKRAKEAAEVYTGENLDNYNLIYRIEMDSQVVGGPSAGAAMTLATIAAVKGKEVREDAVVTGTITESGRIGRVGEIPVKAQAAGSSGIEDFYVPEGQAVKVNYQPVIEEEQRGFLVYRDVEYRRREFNISSYTRRNFGMETSEVGNIYQAADEMLK